MTVLQKYLHKVYEFPLWFISGILIFPALSLLGGAIYVVSAGQISFLFFLIISSTIFEELTEAWAYALSNSYTVNILFALVFWFVIGAIVGWIVEKMMEKK